MRGTRIVLGALVAIVWTLAVVAPGAARADCTGLVVGDLTWYTCAGGASFTEQRIGDLVYLTGDVTGYRQRIGNIEYLHIDPLPIEPAGAPPLVAPVVTPPVSWDPFGGAPLE
jgi:hypothetical protein